MKGNMLFRIIGKLGYIFVVIGFCMPIACDMNGFKLADYMMGNERAMFGVLTIVMLVVAVIGVILGIVFLTGKKIHAVVDWITAAVCIASGLIVYLGCLNDDGVELQSGAYVILVGWIVTLVGEILAGVVKATGGGAFKNMAIFLVVMLIGVGCGKKGGNDYKLNVSANPVEGGIVEIEPAADTYKELATVEVVVKTNEGFVFLGWSGEDSSTSESITITMTGEKNKTLTANFKAIPSPKDSRDGKEYKTVEIGNQVWMAENLNYDAEGSKCYGNKPANCAKYGRLYDWKTAMTACPTGWHLPDDEEWKTLEDAVGGSSAPIGQKLASKRGWENGNGTDDFGFSALPGGFGGSGFDFVGFYGDWWSATENDDNTAWYRRIDHLDGEPELVYRSSDSKSGLKSVRCVRD
jgi:uncharacterized protein (TIGR02145 family)/uncharacterized repeat protein (TIGR02543 family)